MAKKAANTEKKSSSKKGEDKKGKSKEEVEEKPKVRLCQVILRRHEFSYFSGKECSQGSYRCQRAPHSM